MSSAPPIFPAEKGQADFSKPTRSLILATGRAGKADALRPSKRLLALRSFCPKIRHKDRGVLALIKTRPPILHLKPFEKAE
jgi:hypothetical protein